MNNRLNEFEKISTALDALKDRQVDVLLESARDHHTGIGGKSHLIEIEGTPVFVKKVPLTNLERQPNNVLSTSNLFDLPTCCQYGIGSPGFGAWRELSAHKITTGWVKAGTCANFPLLYHSRTICGDTCSPVNLEPWGTIDKFVGYWEDSPALRRRVEELNGASAQILLFLEFVPHNLNAWLNAKLQEGGSSAEAALTMVDDQLTSAIEYMSSHGMIHFDAHFDNILTDGTTIYISDFGLALSRDFTLSPAEQDFFKRHQSFDQSNAAINLLYCVVTSNFGKENWTEKLQECIEGKRELPAYANAVVRKHGQTALAMAEFYRQVKVSKQVEYPVSLIVV